MTHNHADDEPQDPVDEMVAVITQTLTANALILTTSRGGYPHPTLNSDYGAVEAIARGLLARRVAEPSRALAAPPLDIGEVDRLVSLIHDAVYAEPFDRTSASDAVWRVHQLLRSELGPPTSKAPAPDGRLGDTTPDGTPSATSEDQAGLSLQPAPSSTPLSPDGREALRERVIEAARGYLAATNGCRNVNYSRVRLSDALAALDSATAGEPVE